MLLCLGLSTKATTSTIVYIPHFLPPMSSVRVVRVATAPRMRLAWLQWLLSIFLIAILVQGVLVVARPDLFVDTWLGGSILAGAAMEGEDRPLLLWVLVALQALAAALLAAGLVWARLWWHVAGALLAALLMSVALLCVLLMYIFPLLILGAIGWPILTYIAVPLLPAAAAVALLRLRREEIRAARRK